MNENSRNKKFGGGRYIISLAMECTHQSELRKF